MGVKHQFTYLLTYSISSGRWRQKQGGGSFTIWMKQQKNDSSFRCVRTNLSVKDNTQRRNEGNMVLNGHRNHTVYQGRVLKRGKQKALYMQ